MLRSAELNTFSMTYTTYRDLVCHAYGRIYLLSGGTPWRYDGKASCMSKQTVTLLYWYWRLAWRLELWPSWVICAPAFNHKLKKFCIYRGLSEIVFLKKPQKRTEETRIGQWKGYYMEHCGSGPPHPANKFKIAERRMKFNPPLKSVLDIILNHLMVRLQSWSFRECKVPL